MTSNRNRRYAQGVNPPGIDQDPLRARLRLLVAELFRFDLLQTEKITDDEPIIGGRLGVDSLDAVELAISIEEEFGIEIRTREELSGAFASIASLAGFIRAHSRNAAPANAATSPARALGSLVRA
jgi:acyl carrier protein